MRLTFNAASVEIAFRMSSPGIFNGVENRGRGQNHSITGENLKERTSVRRCALRLKFRFSRVNARNETARTSAALYVDTRVAY